jgi:hypothetical protein
VCKFENRLIVAIKAFEIDVLSNSMATILTNMTNGVSNIHCDVIVLLQYL